MSENKQLLLPKEDYVKILAITKNILFFYEKDYDKNLVRIHTRDFKDYDEESLLEDNNFLLNEIVETKELIIRLEQVVGNN